MHAQSFLSMQRFRSIHQPAQLICRNSIRDPLLKSPILPRQHTAWRFLLKSHTIYHNGQYLQQVITGSRRGVHQRRIATTPWYDTSAIADGMQCLRKPQRAKLPQALPAIFTFHEAVPQTRSLFQRWSGCQRRGISS